MVRILFFAKSRRQTITSRVNKAMSNGRILFRAFIEQTFKPKRPNLFRSPDLASRTESFGNVNRIDSFRKALFQRIRTKWIFNTLAATLRRNRAKELMYFGGRFPLVTFIGLSLAKGPTLLTDTQKLEGIAWEIRDLFSSISTQSVTSDTDTSILPELKDYQLGRVLAKGCNAVVYSARNKTKRQPLKKPSSLKKNNPSVLLPVGSLAPYDIAIKMMFNYEAESNALAIWKVMNKEIIPAKRGMFGHNLSLLRVGNSRRLPPHSNIVDMHFAFADSVPFLPEAMLLYPQALPAKLNEHGCGHNMTLFIVMKRYHCTLLEYLQFHKPSFHTSLLLFTQLLEGIVHLAQHQIAHRDLKLDNILIDLSKGLANPELVITDFGCCLPSTHRLRLPFYSEEVFRGGNVSLMPPEVINAKPGLFSVINYTRADLWTAGTLAYEIFGGKNPFYSNFSQHLRSDSYNEEEIPQLPNNVPPVITKLVKAMLQKNCKQRPSPSFAATVCQLLVHLPWNWLSTFTDHKKVLEWLVMTAGITMWQVRKDYKDEPVEQQLRATFLTRVQLSEVLAALQYIADK